MVQIFTFLPNVYIPILAKREKRVIFARINFANEEEYTFSSKPDMPYGNRLRSKLGYQKW